MKKLFQVLIFILAFQMEVRVRAASDLLQEPPSCLKSKESCSIFVAGPVFHYRRDEMSLHADEGSGLMRLSVDRWRLLKGNLWVEKSEDIEIETAYAKLKGSQGQYWVLERGSKVIVRNIDAELTVTMRDGKKLEVPTGFEFWISGINSKGKSEYGMIRPIDVKDHLPLWNSLFSGTKEEFAEQVQHLKANWGDLIEKSALIYQKSAERKLASVVAQEQAVEEKKRQEEFAKKRQREIFYQRTFGR